MVRHHHGLGARGQSGGKGALLVAALFVLLLLFVASSSSQSSTKRPRGLITTQRHGTSQTLSGTPSPREKGRGIGTETDVPPPPCRTLATHGEWVEGVTHPGLEAERWWGVDARDSPNLKGHFRTTGCQYRMLKSSEIRECLRGKRILVAGDSLVRNVLSTLLMFIYPDSTMPPKLHENWNKVPDAAMGTEFVFRWMPKSDSDATEMLALGRDGRPIDALLYAVGAWDIASEHNTHVIAPMTYYNNLFRQMRDWRTSGFRPLHSVFYQLHNGSRGEHRVCYTDDRITAFREAAQCALADAAAGGGFAFDSAMDYIDATSTAPAVHFDRDWLHITGTLNEGLVHVWLNALCGHSRGPAPQCSNSSRASSAPWRVMPPCRPT